MAVAARRSGSVRPDRRAKRHNPALDVDRRRSGAGRRDHCPHAEADQRVDQRQSALHIRAVAARRPATDVGKKWAERAEGVFRSSGKRPLPRSLLVDAGGLKPNTWQRLERLSSAWNQAKLVLGDQPDGAADDEPGVVVNPRRRARTPLTESQVDAIRTARANGESVVSICQRFNVHRMTVWTHTRDLF